MQDEDAAHDIVWREEADRDTRLTMFRDEYYLVPNWIELIDGIPHPKDWETPKSLAAAERSRQREKDEIQAIMGTDLTEYEAKKEYWRRSVIFDSLRNGTTIRSARSRRYY